MSDEERVTYCDRNRANNVWVEGADENGNGGICLLDTMTEAQVVGVLEVDPRARKDLKKVTSDPHLLSLADSVPELPETSELDDLQKNLNRNADSIPFYSLFRGQL